MCVDFIVAGVSAAFADETGVAAAAGLDCARGSVVLSGVAMEVSPNDTLRLRAEGSGVLFVAVEGAATLATSGRALAWL